MKKISIFSLVLILVGSVLTVPARSDDWITLEGVELIDVYWGTDQPTEVSLGDVATLTIVLKYESTYAFTDIIAYISLPGGFEVVNNKASIDVGPLQTNSVIKLPFLIFINPTLKIGFYTAKLRIEYYHPDTPAKDELTIRFEVTGKPRIDVVPPDSIYEGRQQILITLANKGDAVAKYLKITKVYSSSSASAELEHTEILGNLEPGDNVTIPLSLFVVTGMEGKILPLTVETMFLGPRNVVYTYSETLQLPVIANVTKEEIKILSKFLEVTVEAGKVVQYPITAQNSGDAGMSLLLSVEPPADWKVVFKSGVLEVSRLYLEAGESMSLVVEATPPSTVDIGTYTIPVQVKSEKGAILYEMELKATIVGSYAISLEPSTLLTSVTSGSSATFTAKITNTGHTSVTGIRVGVAAPAGWDSSITPTQVESLKPNESSTFNLMVTAPGDTVAGDYLITLTGLSDQVKSDQVQVRVTVTAPTSWVLYGVGVAVALVVALVLVFMKFRRR